jgi:spore coat protein CotH
MTHSALLFFLLALLLAPCGAQAQTPSDLFDPNKLHEVRLEVHPKDWALLKQNFLDNTRYACEFRWNFNGQDVSTPEIAVRSRGQGSRSGIKPSLQVEFNYYDSKQTFLGLKTVVLRANTQDASMMHERVSMEFMRRMGVAAPREAHTRLFVNGEYAGLYTIVESIDEPFLETAFGESNGFLHNYQYKDPFFFEDRGPDPATYSPSPFQPELNGPDSNPNSIPAMVQTLNNASDAAFKTATSAYVDFNAFLTVIATENFLAEQDGIIGDYGLNNFYLYRFAGGNRHTFIPWDKSNTFFAQDWPIMRNVETNRLSMRALAVPEFLDLYRSTLARAAALAGGPGGWLEQEIARQYQQIRQAAYEDPYKLCDPGATGILRPCSNADFDAEFANMIAFARGRAKEVLIQLAGGVTEQTFTMTGMGGFTSRSIESSAALKVGYARVQPDIANTSLTGLAIFSLRNGSTVFTEAAVPASTLVQSGRIYAEVGGPVNTGLAIANPGTQAATVSFYFTDATGRDFSHGSITIPADNQIAQFLNSAPFNSGELTAGTFTFTSSTPVAAVALRGLTNERSEFLITTLPVIPVAAQSNSSVVFPHFADGGGWTTQVILVNPTEQVLTGSLQFLSQGSGTAAGQPIVVATAEAGSAAGFSYSIPPRAAFRLRTDGGSAGASVGSVRVVPASNSSAPAGVSIFSFRNGGITVTEAGVSAARINSAYRMYAESIGNFAAAEAGSIQTGIALANSAATPTVVNFEVTRLDGSGAGLSGSMPVPANGQAALFLSQIPGFAALAAPFQGVLRISAGAAISVVGLRGRYNERGDFLITTTPPVAENEPVSPGELIFPHIVEGAGYTTQFILYSGGPRPASAGALRFFGQTGQPLILNVR